MLVLHVLVASARRQQGRDGCRQLSASDLKHPPQKDKKERESERNSHEDNKALSVSSPCLPILPSHGGTEGPWLISRPQLDKQQKFSNATNWLIHVTQGAAS